MSDAERLAGYVEVWKGAVDDFVALLEQVPEDDWTTPTDLPGWDVKALAAHTAHLEGVLAGNPEETADVGEPPHVTGLMGLYTEIGVVNRRDRSGAEIVAEIREVTDRRYEQLRADPPTDADARPEVDLRRACRGRGRRCCATGRSTSGCTSRTPAARSVVPVRSTRRRRSTPSTTCSRGSATCSARRSARPPAPPR